MVVVVTATATAAVTALGPVGGSIATNAAIASSGAVAMEGAGVGATIVAMGEGALVGVGSMAGGSSTGIALATLCGPIGAAVVGCDKGEDVDNGCSYTWDCWKPVVRDASTQPSKGMTLHCLASHPNVRSLSIDPNELVIGNIFGERFRLNPVNVQGALAFHASVLIPQW